MSYEYRHYRESADYLRARLGLLPDVAVVLGSGLGGLARHMEDPVVLPYGQIPHFKPSTAQSHEGALYSGRLFGVNAALMKGRHHYYEGYTFEDIAFPVGVLALSGVKTILLTNAAGGLKDGMAPGDLMLITDHIKLFGDSPLRGPNLSQLGPRFPDMTAVYSPLLAGMARGAAQDSGVPLFEGVYAYMPGPQYETPAEIRALKALGADAVGMSTVPEAIAAVHCGLRVLGLSCITNLGAGMGSLPLDADEVVRTADRSRHRMEALLGGVFCRLAAQGHADRQ